MKWLEETGVHVIRQKLEEVDLSFFEQLCLNDILFIDSSHMIRPQGDVLVEYLQILPRLARGVVVHIHDIFTPRDYPRHFLFICRVSGMSNICWRLFCAIIIHGEFSLLPT